MARSTARRRALNTLYEADEKNQDISSLVQERIAYPGAQTPLPEYAIEICNGVAEHRKTIDRMLNSYSDKWTVGRMSVIDRNILRIGVWEIKYNDEVPDGVAIDEALSLAKTLSDDGAPSFIHALLSAVSAHKNDYDQNDSEQSEDSEHAESEPAESEPADGDSEPAEVPAAAEAPAADDVSDAAESDDTIDAPAQFDTEAGDTPADSGRPEESADAEQPDDKPSEG